VSESKKEMEKEPAKNLGDRIQRCRRSLGMTKAQLASSAELARAPVSRYEAKQTEDMSVKTLKKMTHALGVSADYLAGRREDKVYFKNPRLQKLIKNMRDLERKDLQCLHKMYLFILENHHPLSEKSKL